MLSASSMQCGQWTWASWQMTEGCVTSGAAAVVLGADLNQLSVEILV